MKNTIDMMVQELEKNNIPVPEGVTKKDGGSGLDNKERFHALVVGFLDSSTFIIDSGASRNMASIKYFFSSMYSDSGMIVRMGDQWSDCSNG